MIGWLLQRWRNRRDLGLVLPVPKSVPTPRSPLDLEAAGARVRYTTDRTYDEAGATKKAAAAKAKTARGTPLRLKTPARKPSNVYPMPKAGER